MLMCTPSSQAMVPPSGSASPEWHIASPAGARRHVSPAPPNLAPLQLASRRPALMQATSASISPLRHRSDTDPADRFEHVVVVQRLERVAKEQELGYALYRPGAKL